MLLVTNSLVLTTLSSFLLPITEEIHVCTGQRTISAYVLYYLKFDREVNAFIKEMTEWLLTKT